MSTVYNPGSAFTLTSTWNPNRRHPVTHEVRAHRGDDWAAPTGTPIPAAASGVVVFKGVMNGYGNVVILEHIIDGDVVHTWYAHMNAPSPLAMDEEVAAGDTVGAVGNTGIGTGPHLHFEVAVGGERGNPNRAEGHPTVDPSTFEFPDPGLRIFHYEVIDSLGNSHKGTLFGYTDEWFERMLADIHEEVLRDNSPENLKRLVDNSATPTPAQRPEYLYVYVNPYAKDSDEQDASGSQGKDKLYGNDKNNILDASGGDDYLYGEEGHDVLYGGEGADELNGGEGSDVLKGGQGKDTYIFEGNFGRDIVIDSDGSGAIVIDGTTLGSVKQTVKDGIAHRDSTNTVEVIKFDEGGSTSLLITSLTNRDNSIHIKNWKEGELGINLAQFEPKEITGLKQVSGTGAKDALYAERGKYLNDSGIEQIGNYVASEIHGGESKDYIAGSYGADRLYGDGGNDWITAEGGYIDGGDDASTSVYVMYATTKHISSLYKEDVGVTTGEKNIGRVKKFVTNSMEKMCIF